MTGGEPPIASHAAFRGVAQTWNEFVCVSPACGLRHAEVEVTSRTMPVARARVLFSFAIRMLGWARSLLGAFPYPKRGDDKGEDMP